MDSNTGFIYDIIEINSDIDLQEAQSKLPGFIKKIKFKKMRRRLYNTLDKLDTSENIVLNKHNLLEYFNYILGNIGNDGYKSVKRIVKTNSSMNVLVKFDTLEAEFIFDRSNHSFDVTLKDSDTSSGDWKRANITCTELSSSNHLTRSMLLKLNDQLLDDIRSFVIEYILNKQGVESYDNT